MIKINEISEEIKENIKNEVFHSKVNNYYEVENIIIVEYDTENGILFIPFDKNGKQIGFMTYNSFSNALFNGVKLNN